MLMRVDNGGVDRQSLEIAIVLKALKRRVNTPRST